MLSSQTVATNPPCLKTSTQNQRPMEMKLMSHLFAYHAKEVRRLRWGGENSNPDLDHLEDPKLMMVVD